MEKDIRSDSELVEAFRAKDQGAYIELVERYTEKAHNLAVRITRSREDAEEILQDVFITVFNKIDSFKGESAFSSWLYRVTVNTAFMKLRKRKKHASVELDESIPSTNGWTMDRSDSCDINYMTSRHQLRHELEEAISKLPDEYKLIFVLRDVDGLSNQEVGEVLSLSVPAVKSRLHRSRSMLRKRLMSFYRDYRSLEEISYGPKGERLELQLKQAA